MKRLIALLLTAVLCLSASALDAEAAEEGRWRRGRSGWWYQNADGSYPADRWQKLGGVWYRFDGDGYMQTGWVRSDGNWYYLRSSGAMATGWVQDGGTWYYLKGSGAMATGWVQDGGTWYYLRSSGAMATGWVQDGGDWYYLDGGSGAMLTNQWVEDGGWYYLDASGAAYISRGADSSLGDGDFVRVRDYIPDIAVELMYATDRNFTGRVIYSFTDAWLRYGTVKKLAEAQRLLRAEGCGLKIWDAFRPVSAQFRLWEICPDARYVADPNYGYSTHSRGNTVDVTLVDGDGNELPMPTGFDDFSALADRDYSDVWDERAAENACLLENVMAACGFTPYWGEWWHFSDTVSYGVGDGFEPPA